VAFAVVGVQFGKQELFRSCRHGRFQFLAVIDEALPGIWIDEMGKLYGFNL